MAQKVVNQARGLKTFKNELMLPDGSLIKADDIVIDRDNTEEPRRGFKLYGSAFSATASDRAKQLLQYKDRILLHYDSALMYDDGAGSFSAFSGTFAELSTGLRIKGKEKNSNFYFTTTAGIKKISATAASEFTTDASYIYDAGAAKGLDGSGTSNIGVAGFMTTQTVVAYRHVWGYKDANDNLVLGSPSERIIVRNTDTVSTAVNNLTFTIPSEVNGDSKYFYQLYRSPLTADASGTVTPSDELRLVYEAFPSASDFSNGYVSTTDITPEDFRSGGANLYTNPISGDPNGNGILGANEKPPVAQDIAEYRNSMFYANTKTRHQKEVSLISAALLSNDDTFIIGNTPSGETTYTFKATENIGSRHVALATGGTVSQNIDDTARSLCRVINRNTGLVYAYYISGVNDVPGMILLESRVLNDITFYIKVGTGVDGTAFNPELPVDGDADENTATSTNLSSPNRIYYSKTNEPEAVPILNKFDVGAKDQPIRRIAALRDSLFIFKDDGIYRLSGTDTSNFTVTLSDSSAIITAPDSLAILNNEIYFASTQGIVVVAEAGQPRVISREIETDILTPTQFSAFGTTTFGLAYESDRSYLIAMPTKSTDTTATQIYRYNVFTQTWVRWDIDKICGIVLESDDKLYWGPDDAAQLEQERKAFDRTDYADREYSKTLPPLAASGTSLILPSLTNVAKYDAIVQSSYISVARFNRLLTKLDDDIGLDDTDYYSTLAVSAGDAIGTSLVSLVAKIDSDDTSASYSVPTGTQVFETVKTEFNTLMTELNASTQVFFTNYTSYTTTVDYESIITNVDTGSNTVTLRDTLPWIEGVVTVYKSINSKIEWAPLHVGDVSLMKMFREASIMFDQYNFSGATVKFRSDLSDNYEDSEFNAEGTGIYGNQQYGAKTFGGLASQIPHRTYVPRNKMRCRFIIVSLYHSGAREKFAVNGYSVTFNQSVTPRAYKD